MNFEHLNKQIVTFCAISLLFVGSLFYFVSVAFNSRDAMEAKQTATDNYIDSI